MLKLSSLDPVALKCKALAIPVAEDKSLHQNRIISSTIKHIKGYKEFTGKESETMTVYDPKRLNAKRIFLFGVGKAAEIDTEKLRTMAGKSIKKAIAFDLTEVVILIPSAKALRLAPEEVISAVGEGARLANHQFDRYKKPKHQVLKQIRLVAEKPFLTKHRTLINQLDAVCGATLLARDWVNTPANDKPPAVFARKVKQAAQNNGLKVEIKDEPWLKKQGFKSMLAVAQGSNNRPRLVVLKYLPKGAKKTIVLVGKGVTFDSGGLNLKPTGAIETMKCDMSGAAAVAAALVAAPKRKVKHNLIGVLPLVENMPSGKAFRPGDIIKTWAGKTVEIGNTDAEGRLILIDAIAWAVDSFSPDITIDMATLTGACVVALGEKIAGVFSPDDKLADNLVKAGRETHERCWQLPLPEDYKELLKSEIADTGSIGGGRWGGAITAALFLSEFVKDIRWAHIDIAGPAFLKKGGPYGEAGASGFGVRLIHRWLDTL